MDAPSVIRLAAAAYPVEVLPDWEALVTKLRNWVAEAAEAGAEMAVFPEYAAMEAALIGGAVHTDWEIAAAETASKYHATVAALARDFRLHLLSGSGPSWEGENLVNRAVFCTPLGQSFPVDKVVLTPWERANTRLRPGRNPVGFDTKWGRVGVLICYDSEFPALAQCLRADILLIPSCTEAETGQSRVRIAAQSRALESQCVSVHAPLLGRTPCPIIDQNTGAAGVYVSPDRGLPSDGVLAQSALNQPGWVISNAPLSILRARRQDGEARLRVDQATLSQTPALVHSCVQSDAMAK